MDICVVWRQLNVDGTKLYIDQACCYILEDDGRRKHHRQRRKEAFGLAVERRGLES